MHLKKVNFIFLLLRVLPIPAVVMAIFTAKASGVFPYLWPLILVPSAFLGGEFNNMAKFFNEEEMPLIPLKPTDRCGILADMIPLPTLELTASIGDLLIFFGFLPVVLYYSLFSFLMLASLFFF